MALVNRDKDVSEQREVYTCSFGAAAGASGLGSVAFGTTLPLLVVPYPMELQQVKVASQGLSGAAVMAVEVLRFISGAGLTGLVGLGATLTLAAIGTSGVQSVSLVAPGSTLVQLQANDLLVARMGVGTVNCLNIDIVVKALQDIKNQYNNY